MAPSKTWLSAVGLCLVSSAAASRLGAKILAEHQSHGVANLVKITKPSSPVYVGKTGGVSRRQDEGCYGTCQECFGDDYRECPDNESLCYSPNDPTTGCETGPPDFDIPDFPDMDDLPGDTEYCTSGDSCEDCFGEGYELCPGTTDVCWNPDVPSTGCDGSSPDDSVPDDSGSPDDIDYCTGDSCADCFGSGYELCPGSTMMCHNPDIPETSTVCDDVDDDVDDDDTGNDEDDEDDDDTDDRVTLPPSTPSPTGDESSTEESTTEPTSGSNNDDDDDSSSGGDRDETAGDSSDDDDDDDTSAAAHIGMAILPVIAGAVGVAALL